MDIEELKVKITASFEDFQGAIKKIKSQLKGLNETTDKLNQKFNKNSMNSYKPKIDTDSLKKEIDDTTNKITKKTEEMVNKIDSKTSKMVKSLKEKMSKLSDITIKGIGNFKIPNINQKGDSTPKTSVVSNKKSNRGPPSLELEDLTNTRLGKIQELDITDRQIENLRKKLKLLSKQLDNTFNSEGRNKLEGTILSTESRINSLINKSIKLGSEIETLDNEIDELSRSTDNANSSLNKTEDATNKASKGVNKLNNSIKKTSNASKSYSNGIGMIVKSMFTWSIIIPTILKGLSAMATGLYNNLMTNQQFSNSLAQIKSNLMIAFTPIYQAILPAINALMSALSIATQYIASFISAIFGKTYEQSKQATQSLIDAKTAMGVYGDSAKAAGEAAKDALGLASFDEINSLNSQSSGDSSGSGGSGASGVPSLVTPALDTTSVDSAMKSLVDKIKAYFSTFNFEPLINSFNRLKKSVEPIINNLGKIIKWFLVEILDPLAHWTISDLLPAFLNLIAGALDFLNPILEVFMSLGSWLWDSFLQPIASWTGGVIVDVLNGVADILSSIGTWISEHKPLIEDLILIIGSFAAAWGLVTLALNAIWVAAVAWNVVCGISTIATTAFGAAVAFLTSPIGIAILAIGSIIAIGVLLYKHWDEIKAKAIEVWDKVKQKVSEFCDKTKEKFDDFKVKMSEVWDKIKEKIRNVCDDCKEKINQFKEKVFDSWNNIKNKFNEFKTWLGNVFATDWSKRFGFLGDILNGYLTNVRNIFNSVKQIFSGIIDFIAGAFTGNWSRAWQGVVSIFKGIMNGIGALIKTPLNTVISLINGAISGINGLGLDIPDWVPILGGKKFSINIPKIPMLAKGGIIDSPTLAMVGEAGKEAVVPLENNTQGLDLLASKLMERLGGATSNNNSFGDGDLILQIDGSVIGKVALKQLRKMQRQGNVTLIPT